MPAGLENGTFVAPLLVELPGVADLDGEHFGPILHVVRFAADELDGILEAVASLGYGLTFGIQTRIERRGRDVARQAPAGNVYVNRNLIGAMVGSQPFGGRGLSGTGPKAGGPNYLRAFLTERTVSVNTAAVGGNATLLAGDDP